MAVSVDIVAHVGQEMRISLGMWEYSDGGKSW